VAARADHLAHRWSAEDFLRYRTTTRDLDLFESMAEDVRRRAVVDLRARLHAMAEGELVFRPPVVSIVARRA
jgi:hypothetical protein